MSKTRAVLSELRNLGSCIQKHTWQVSYDDELVIQGNSSLGKELASLRTPPDILVAPVGGGGLISGLITGIETSSRRICVFGAEPLLANDAAVP